MNTIKTLNNVSKNDKLKVLTALLNFGSARYDFNFNKVKNLMSKFQDPNQTCKDHDIYTPERFYTFLSGEDELSFRCLWETLYYKGLRIS